ncbi:MAG: hypothetical protein NTZ14_10050 [Hyphomicrobiales bacterium]|nr:hypothetical protein [Hyphomicrobiales bacterium]
MQEPDKSQQEAKAILDRAEREQQGLLSSSMARASDHFSGKDAVGQGEGGATDAVELWGRRIGRSLSLIGVLALGYMLGVQLKLW